VIELPARYRWEYFVQRSCYREYTQGVQGCGRPKVTIAIPSRCRCESIVSVLKKTELTTELVVAVPKSQRNRDGIVMGWQNHLSGYRDFEPPVTALSSTRPLTGAEGCGSQCGAARSGTYVRTGCTGRLPSRIPVVLFGGCTLDINIDA
jgi:hypothetical protein